MNKSSANKQRILRKEERKLAKHPYQEIIILSLGNRLQVQNRLH